MEPMTEAHDAQTPTWRGTDMTRAQSVDDVMELRKQETRRRVTYIVVGVFCISAIYLIGLGTAQLQAAAFSGLLGIAGSIIGFYFGAKQTGQ